MPGQRNIVDHLLRGEFVALKLDCFALFTGQKRDQRAQHCARPPEPLPSNRDDRMQPTSFAQAVEYELLLSAPAHEA